MSKPVRIHVRRQDKFLGSGFYWEAEGVSSTREYRTEKGAINGAQRFFERIVSPGWKILDTQGREVLG